MRIPFTQEFETDQKRHNLRYTCKHCTFYLHHSQSCAHEWPNQDHAKEATTEIVFCKEFELG